MCTLVTLVYSFLARRQPSGNPRGKLELCSQEGRPTGPRTRRAKPHATWPVRSDRRFLPFAPLALAAISAKYLQQKGGPRGADSQTTPATLCEDRRTRPARAKVRVGHARPRPSDATDKAASLRSCRSRQGDLMDAGRDSAPNFFRVESPDSRQRRWPHVGSWVDELEIEGTSDTHKLLCDGGLGVIREKLPGKGRRASRFDFPRPRQDRAGAVPRGCATAPCLQALPHPARWKLTACFPEHQPASIKVGDSHPDVVIAREVY